MCYYRYGVLDRKSKLLGGVAAGVEGAALYFLHIHASLCISYNLPRSPLQFLNIGASETDITSIKYCAKIGRRESRILLNVRLRSGVAVSVCADML